jgi:hypothetical protein
LILTKVNVSLTNLRSISQLSTPPRPADCQSRRKRPRGGCAKTNTVEASRTEHARMSFQFFFISTKLLAPSCLPELLARNGCPNWFSEGLQSAQGFGLCRCVDPSNAPNVLNFPGCWVPSQAKFEVQILECRVKYDPKCCTSPRNQSYY